jgi:integrase
VGRITGSFSHLSKAHYELQEPYHRSSRPNLKDAGLPDLVFQVLRHTCATIRFMKGQHPTRVSGLLGHSSVAFTLDKYSHIIPGLGVVDTVEDALK